MSFKKNFEECCTLRQLFRSGTLCSSPHLDSRRSGGGCSLDAVVWEMRTAAIITEVEYQLGSLMSRGSSESGEKLKSGGF